MNVVFWALVGLIFYAYCGYPFLLVVLSLVTFRRTRKENILPTVTVIIAVYNEAQIIRRKIEATLRLDYPREKLDIIVVSDGSDDGTVAEVSSVASRRVELLAFPERRGKTAVQNLAARRAKGDILLFSDATTEFDRKAVRALVANFADPSVGAAGAELRYVNRGGTTAGEGGGFYWSYERLIRKLESRVCSLIGVSGCCYAVRRRLYEDLPADVISDFVIAQVMYRHGRRTVYEPEAICYEDTNDSFSDEFAMRVRVAVRTLHGLWRMRRLLNPLRYGFYSIELLSHKVLRYLIPLFLAAALAVNLVLLAERSRTWLYVLMFALQLLFYAAVIAGWRMRTRRFISLPFYFFVTNLALMVAFLRFLRGEKQVLWKPLRK